MKNIAYPNVVLDGGFWKKKEDLDRKSIVMAIYKQFKDTGRFDAFKCNWREGMPDKPHYFWDSDVAKWIEGASYLIAKKPDKRLEKIIEDVIDDIEKNQFPEGYFNIYFTVVEPENRFQKRDLHELYCAGHLMEAAVAYYYATGKKRFLDIMCRYADYIELRFKTLKNAAFGTPGHEEIELALVKLYECTKEKRYLDLALWFINERGCAENPAENMRYNQSHLPVRNQTTAEGHAVRAVYLYTAMADLALLTGDDELRTACETLFDNITKKRMYITGGIGSTYCGEAFTVDYDLPNLLAYTESCAGIGLIFFAARMQKIEADSKYADTIERVLYNGFLSSVSLDGKRFFYENPLEILPYKSAIEQFGNKPVRYPKPRRSEVFSCSCCPPNILRLLPCVSDLIYTTSEDTLFVHQYMASTANFEIGGKKLTVKQETRFPDSGKIRITVTGAPCKVAVRVPEWYRGDAYKTVKGYAYFDVRDGGVLELDFPMKPRLVEARPEVINDCARVVLMRGPVVYCMEGVDNGDSLRDLRLDPRSRIVAGKNAELGVPTLSMRALRRKKPFENAPLYSDFRPDYEEVTAKFIPYYAFANRELCEMQVFNNLK